MPRTLRDLSELTAIANDDWVHVNDINDVTNQDKKISRINLIGTAISGGGSISMSNFNLIIPASGPAVIRSGAPTQGMVAEWVDNNFLKAGTIPVSDIARLSGTTTFEGPIILNANGMVTVPSRAGFAASPEPVALAVETAVTITGLVNQGLVLFQTSNVAGGHGTAFINYRALSGPFVHVWGLDPYTVSGANLVPSTLVNGIAGGAPLTGSTGPAGKINFQCTGTTGQIILENRAGFALTYRIMRLGL